MTHPIHRYRAIAAKWDEILAAKDGGKLRRPITAEECCRMLWHVENEVKEFLNADEDLKSILDHNSKASNGV